MLPIYPHHPQQSTKYPSFKGHPSNFKPYKAERDYLTIHAYIARKFQYSENKLTQFIDKITETKFFNKIVNKLAKKI